MSADDQLAATVAIVPTALVTSGGSVGPTLYRNWKAARPPGAGTTHTAFDHHAVSIIWSNASHACQIRPAHLASERAHAVTILTAAVAGVRACIRDPLCISRPALAYRPHHLRQRCAALHPDLVLDDSHKQVLLPGHKSQHTTYQHDITQPQL